MGAVMIYYLAGPHGPLCIKRRTVVVAGAAWTTTPTTTWQTLKSAMRAAKKVRRITDVDIYEAKDLIEVERDVRDAADKRRDGEARYKAARDDLIRAREAFADAIQDPYVALWATREEKPPWGEKSGV